MRHVSRTHRVPLVQQMANGSRPFTDEASKHTCASSKSQDREAKTVSRWLQCDMKRARH